MAQPTKCARLSLPIHPTPGTPDAFSVRLVPERCEIWLEKLPLEVLMLIAVYVCRSDTVEDRFCEHTGSMQGLSALSLGRTSLALRRAVVAVLNKKLVFEDSFGDVDETVWWDWICFFGGDVRELSLAHKECFEFDEREPTWFSVPLLTSPQLRVVHIEDHSEHVEAVGRSSSIRDVSITLRGRLPAKTIFAALAKIRLEALLFTCKLFKWRYPNRCLFGDSESADLKSNLMARCFPHLSKFELVCNCHEGKVHPIWGILPALSKLRETKITKSLVPVPDSALTFLSRLDSVQISLVEDPLTFAMKIGASVTEISCRFNWFNEEELLSLVKFPNLRMLCCGITEGAEASLPVVLEKLPKLRALELRWNQASNSIPRYRYATVIPGIFLRTIQLLRNLTALCLTDVYIPLNELTAILNAVGPQLQIFRVSLGGPAENSFEWLLTLLQTAADCAHKLTGLSVFGLNVLQESIDKDPKRRERQARLMLSALRRLKMRAPYVSIQWLEKELCHKLNGTLPL